MNVKFVCIRTRLNILYIHLKLNNSWWFHHMTTLMKFCPLQTSWSPIQINIYSLFYRLYEIVWLWRYFHDWDLQVVSSALSMLSPVSFQRSVSSRLTSISIASIPTPQPFLSGVWQKLENTFEKSHFRSSGQWRFTFYIYILYAINKYTYSRDAYHMLFHMIDSVNLRSFKIKTFK